MITKRLKSSDFFFSSCLGFVAAANLVLQSTVERLYVNDAYCDIQRGVFIVRGENVLLLGEIVCDTNFPFFPVVGRDFCPAIPRHILGLSCHARIWTVRTTSRFGRLRLRKFLQGSDSQTGKRNTRIRSIERNCVLLDSRTRGRCLSRELGQAKGSSYKYRNG